MLNLTWVCMPRNEHDLCRSEHPVAHPVTYPNTHPGRNASTCANADSRAGSGRRCCRSRRRESPEPRTHRDANTVSDARREGAFEMFTMNASEWNISYANPPLRGMWISPCSV